MGATDCGIARTSIDPAMGAGAIVIVAVPTHIAAQHGIPRSLSGFGLESGSPEQCEAAAASPRSPPAACLSGISMALAVMGAKSTASANSAWRSLARLFGWRIIMSVDLSPNPLLGVTFLKRTWRYQSHL